MTVLSAVLLFGFLIFIHELGHFVLAKLSGVRVDKFSLGFGPRVVGRKIGETEYLISAIPLGGYVKMMGEEADDEVEPAQKERSFKEQPVLKRTSIVFAGPLFNLLTAVVIFFFVYLSGFPTLLPVIGEIMPDTPAARSVLRAGDRVTEIDHKPLRQWQEMTSIIYSSPGKELTFTIQRGTETLTTVITPEPKKMKDLFGEEQEVGLIGVKPSGDTFVVREDLPGAATSAVQKTWEIASLTVIGIVKLIQRIVPADTIGGPILIFQLAEKQASAGGLSFFTFAAVISVNLAILNLLPIPVLDGGHLLFLAVEAIRKKPLSERAVSIAQRVGIALILFLMAFAMYNDIFRLISGKPIP
jgi:regulator of sigma E protease